MREIKFHRQSLTAAIRDFDERRPIPFRRIARPQQVQVRRKFNQSFWIARCEIDIGNNPVRREPEIDGEMNLRLNALVWACISERTSLQYVGPANEFYA